MKYLASLLTLVALLFGQYATAEQPELTAEEAPYETAIKNIWESLNHQQGKITLPNGVATLDVPDNFYYLSPKDAESVLVDIWGNPPGGGTNSQGMLFATDATPVSGNAWGVIIDYEQDGYVSDADADKIDYDDLLTDMQASTQEDSKQRVQQGYEPIQLVGWAAKPYYDKPSHKLHWAQELKFGDAQLNTLNYNIRVLGRKGVLILNFVADMDQKPLIDNNINTVLTMTEFDQGSRYQDFNPDLDEVAAYGIGALVAGKVAVKAGLFAAALIFLKKFGVLILVGLGVLGKKLFKGKAA